MSSLGWLLVVVAFGVGLAIHWFPTAASTQAGKIDTLYDVLMIVSVPIFVIVATVVVSSVIFFRMRPGQENEDGPPIDGRPAAREVDQDRIGRPGHLSALTESRAWRGSGPDAISSSDRLPPAELIGSSSMALPPHSRC